MKNKQNRNQTRETAAVLMFVIVFISLLKPISPFISDFLGHTFWSEQHHIALHQNGVDHIDEQVQKINETSHDRAGEAATSTFNIETSLIYFVSFQKIEFYLSYTSINFSALFVLNSQQNLITEIQPPDYSCNVLPIHA